MGKQLLKAAAVSALLALTAGRTEAGPVHALYTFEDLPVGTTTPFSDTQGGVTAQFNGEAGTTGVVIVNPSPYGFAPPFTGNILMSGGGHFGLIVNFSTSIRQVRVDVGGVNSNPGDISFGVNAYSGGTYVGGTGISCPNPDEYIAQGTIVFSSNTPFDTIYIEPSSYFLWVDNLAIDSAVVPEPAGLTLATVCVGALAVRGWRRRCLAT